MNSKKRERKRKERKEEQRQAYRERMRQTEENGRNYKEYGGHGTSSRYTDSSVEYLADLAQECNQ